MLGSNPSNIGMVGLVTIFCTLGNSVRVGICTNDQLHIRDKIPWGGV